MFAWINVGTVVAQKVPVPDSLAIAIGRDTLAVKVDTLSSTHLQSDSLRVDSMSVALTKEPMFKSRIKYKAADSVKFIIQNRRAYMYKETQINYEDMELKAYITEFDMVSKNVYAEGGRDSLNNIIGAPKIKMGRDEFDASKLSYNFESKKGVIHEIKTKQGEGFLQAEKSKRYADGHIDLGGAIYTTCDADHPHFGLRLSKAKIVPGDKVVFGPAYMELLDIPLYPLFLPFGFFPQTNKQAVSGLIPPSPGMEMSRGLSLTNGGYYFAFNDHFDATILGEIYSTGTWKVQPTTRYMKRYKYSGNVNLEYGVYVSGEKGLDLSKQKSYSIVWSHQQDAKAHPYHTFTANVNYSSSKFDQQFNFYNQNTNSPNNTFTNTKTSNITFQQKWPNTPFRFSTNMRANQSTSDGMVNIDFPNFNFSMEKIYPFRKKEPVGKPKWYEDIGLQYDATMQNTLRGHEDNLFSDKNLKNMKNGFQHKIPFSINFKVLKFINITPSMNYTGVLYTSQIRKTFDADSIVNGKKGVTIVDTIRGLSYAHALAPTISVSMNPKFYLTNMYGPNSKLMAIRTVISPTVGVSYVPDLSRFFNYHRELLDKNGNVVVDKNGKVQEVYDIYKNMGTYSTPTPSSKQTGSVSLGINGNVEAKVRTDDSTSNVQSRKIKILNNISATTRYDIFRDTMRFDPVSLSANTTIAGINLTMSGTLDPYKLSSAGTRINQFASPRLTRMTFSTGISLPMNNNDNKKDDKKGDIKEDYTYFDVPWNISFDYNLSYSKEQFVGKFIQTLSFRGDVKLTTKWSLNFNSSYDFEAKKIAQMQINITRDLHCWQMSMNVTPFGPLKTYLFKINVKSATLQDLKYEKRKNPGDFDRTVW